MRSWRVRHFRQMTQQPMLKTTDDTDDGNNLINDVILRIEVEMIPDPNACYDEAESQQSDKRINGPIRFWLCLCRTWHQSKKLAS